MSQRLPTMFEIHLQRCQLKLDCTLCGDHRRRCRDAVELILAPRPEVEKEYLVSEVYAPKWQGEKFIECGGCRVKLGSPLLCPWCLYVRERQPHDCSKDIDCDVCWDIAEKQDKR